jgi:hypothetical protein
MMTSIKEKEREQKVVDQVSIDNLWKHTSYIAEEDRLSGSMGEARAVCYFKNLMEGFGYAVKVLEIENFISLPLSASIKVISPEEKELSCITHSFSVSTPPGGLEAELIYGAMQSNQEVKGKIVLSEGIATPGGCWNIEQKGAIGQVWINENEIPTNMIITTVWGHPTPETMHYIPKNAVVSTGKANGHYLKSLCEHGPVKICLFTETWTGFKMVPLAIADLPGRMEPDKYVLFTGHIDSWHKGASDNATANACILEVARIAAEYRRELRRGVRCIWWSGHSHGRYSGSTWYADNHWEDLYDHAIVHLNVDSLGCKGSTDYSEVECSVELYDLEKSLIQDYAGQTPPYHRIPRTGDSSFWGIGVPSLFGLLSRQPPGKSTNVMFPGLPWYWHTEADTLDKIDREILLKDARIYMATLWRLCTAPVLPFRFVRVADEIILHLSGLQEKAKGVFDMTSLLEKARLFRTKADQLDRICGEVTSQFDTLPESSAEQKAGEIARILNRSIMTLSRTMIPMTYCVVDRFDADRALHIPFMPRFQRVAEMGSMDPHSDLFKFVERSMVRERNRVLHCLNEAITLMDETLRKIGTR